MKHQCSVHELRHSPLPGLLAVADAAKPFQRQHYIIPVFKLLSCLQNQQQQKQL